MIRFGVRRCCEDAYDVGLIPIEVSIKASESVESIENAIAQIDTFETELDKISEPYEEELESDEPLQPTTCICGIPEKNWWLHEILFSN